jgi:polysaccharide export outer membrane protein
MKNSKYLLNVLVVGLLLQGCKSYTSNVILKTEPTEINWKSTYEKAVIENPIKVGDKIQYSLFTNQGESIIDPNGTLMTSKSFGDGNELSASIPTYEVLESGMCLFPLLGKIAVIGLKTSQLDSLLSTKYETYYNGVYVISKVVNKKIIILGGKGGQILPYVSNMNLLEALAAYGGLDEKSQGYNIRIIRGDLKNPEVTLVNLRTINDMKNSIVNLRPDDVIYIEPIRRPGAEAVRDNMYILNFLQIITTLSLLINNFTK